MKWEIYEITLRGLNSKMLFLLQLPMDYSTGPMVREYSRRNTIQVRGALDSLKNVSSIILV